MNKREDFQNTVRPFFEKIRGFDPVLHGCLSDFVVKSYLICLANKGEYVDYSFVPEGLDTGNIKLREDILIASYAFKIVVSEVEQCGDSDMVEIYDKFQDIGKRKGWSSLEFDKQCLNLMGIEVCRVEPPMYLPSIQSGKDYN